MQLGGVLMALVTTGMTGPLFDRFLPRVVPSAAGEHTVVDETTEGLETIVVEPVSAHVTTPTVGVCE